MYKYEKLLTNARRPEVLVKEIKVRKKGGGDIYVIQHEIFINIISKAPAYTLLRNMYAVHSIVYTVRKLLETTESMTSSCFFLILEAFFKRSKGSYFICFIFNKTIQYLWGGCSYDRVLTASLFNSTVLLSPITCGSQRTSLDTVSNYPCQETFTLDLG